MATEHLRSRVDAPSGDLRSGPVPESIRRPVEEWAGVDLSHVRLDTDHDPRSVAGGTGTVGAFHDATIYPGVGAPLVATSAGREIVLHELVHAAQLTDVAPDASSGLLRPLKLDLCSGCGTLVDPLDTLRSGNKLTPAQAKALLAHYDTLADKDRDAVVNEFHKVGAASSGIRRLLESLDPADLEAKRNVVSDIQERIQRRAVETTAGKSLAQLGAEQGAHMKAEAKKKALADAAAAAKAKGIKAPAAVSDADVAKAHAAETKRTSPVTTTVTNAWDALPAADKSKWNSRATAVIAGLVAACKKLAPEFKITAANLKWAPKEVAAEGSNVYAFSGDPISFGMSFVETAEADPEYAVRVVIHEIAGHPDFGDRFKSAEAIIYAEAHTAEPSLGSPWDTKEEKNTFGYLGTEIYAALREVRFEKKLSPADAKKGLVTAIEPEANVDNKVGLIKSKYAAGVAGAIVQGLYERFRVDPRIDPKALALYKRIVQKHFGAGALK